MYKLTVNFLITLLLINNSSCCKVEDTELVLSFITFRHGDKTPIKRFCELVKYRDTLINLTMPYGFGQITPEGMRKDYEIGKFIQNRYTAFLSRNFNPAEVFVRSTFTSRTIFTALNAISAIYSLPQPYWIKTMDWTPLPYSTVVPKYDFNAGFVNCPVYIDNTNKLIINSTSPVMMPFMWMRDTLFNETGFDISKTPLLTFIIYDLLESQEVVGYELSEKLKNLLPDLKKAADASSSVIFGKSEFIPLLSGVLLNEFYKVVAKARTGEIIPKLYMYSAHDANVNTFMFATRVTPRQGYPLPGSLFALELRRELSTGRYFILPMYVSQPGEPITYLKIAGCGSSLCEFNKFRALTSKYALDIESWRSRCGWNRTAYVSDCVIT